MEGRKFHPREIIDQAVDKYEKWVTKEIEDLLEHEKKKLLTKIEKITGII